MDFSIASILMLDGLTNGAPYPPYPLFSPARALEPGREAAPARREDPQARRAPAVVNGVNGHSGGAHRARSTPNGDHP